MFFFVKQKPAYERATGDWSSDVCKSDVRGEGREGGRKKREGGTREREGQERERDKRERGTREREGQQRERDRENESGKKKREKERPQMSLVITFSL